MNLPVIHVINSLIATVEPAATEDSEGVEIAPAMEDATGKSKF